MDHHGKNNRCRHKNDDGRAFLRETLFGEVHGTRANKSTLFARKATINNKITKKCNENDKNDKSDKSDKSGKSGENSKNNNTQERAKSIFGVTIRKSGGF